MIILVIVVRIIVIILITVIILNNKKNDVDMVPGRASDDNIRNCGNNYRK